MFGFLLPHCFALLGCLLHRCDVLGLAFCGYLNHFGRANPFLLSSFTFYFSGAYVFLLLFGDRRDLRRINCVRLPDHPFNRRNCFFHLHCHFEHVYFYFCRSFPLHTSHHFQTVLLIPHLQNRLPLHWSPMNVFIFQFNYCDYQNHYYPRSFVCCFGFSFSWGLLGLKFCRLNVILLRNRHHHHFPYFCFLHLRLRIHYHNFYHTFYSFSIYLSRCFCWIYKNDWTISYCSSAFLAAVVTISEFITPLSIVRILFSSYSFSLFCVKLNFY